MRKYVQVENCPKCSFPHQHMEEDDRIFCHGVGAWLTGSDAISYKELRAKWFPKKEK